MKTDQIVRGVGMGALVLLYVVYLGLNGMGTIATGLLGLGTVHPLALAMVFVLVLAFPELIHALPFGPTRK